MATVKGVDVRSLVPIPVATTPLPAYYGGGPRNKFNYLSAASSTYDYVKVGAPVGGGVGCVAGAIVGSLLANPIAAGAGCILGAGIGGKAGAIIFGLTGFVQGGHDLPYADSLQY
jgi:hypothetical protein